MFLFFLGFVIFLVFCQFYDVFRVNKGDNEGKSEIVAGATIPEMRCPRIRLMGVLEIPKMKFHFVGRFLFQIASKMNLQACTL